MADVKLVNSADEEITYAGVDTIEVYSTDDDGTTTYVSEHLILNQVQADWNQTDDTQPDYIKNKPETFEAEDELPAVTTNDNGKFLGVVDGAWVIVDAPEGGSSNRVTIFAEQECTFAPNSNYGGLYFCSMDLIRPFEVGETYTIVWNGMKFSCVASEMSFGMAQGIGVGNGAIVGISEDSGEPFLFGYFPDADDSACLSSSTETSHTIEIYQGESILPEVTTEDNGKILGVVDGKWQKMEVEVSGGGSSQTGTIERDVTIEWNTSVTPTVTFDIAAFGYTAHKISDAMPTKEQMLSANWMVSSANGSGIYNFTISEDDIATETDISTMIMLSSPNPSFAYVICYDVGEVSGSYSGMSFTAICPETGIYQIWDTGQALPTTMFGSMTYTVTEEVDFVQPNWEQNDTASPEYIKNRPFDDKIPIEMMFYEYEDTIFKGEFVDTWNGNSWDGDMDIKDDSSTTLVSGKTYTYIWDGVKYTSKCIGVEGMYIIGNMDAATGTGDNGQPVVIIRDMNELCWYAMIMQPSTDSTISGKYPCEIIGLKTQTLAPEFVGGVSWDKVAEKPFGDISAGTVVLEESVTMGASASGDTMGMTVLNSLNPSYVIAGANYDVAIGSTHYDGLGAIEAEMLVINIKSGDSLVGGIAVNYSDAGINVFINDTSFLPNGNTYDVKVTLTSDAVTKINSKYIPEVDALPEVTTDDNGKTLVVSDGAWTVGSGLPTVTAEDNGKTLVVTEGAWTVGSGLPQTTIDDAGKFLRVSDTGAWIIASVYNVEEVSF